MSRNLNLLKFWRTNIIILITVLLLFNGAFCSPDTGTVKNRTYKYINATESYCIYNKYSSQDVIYECVQRSTSPLSDASCLYLSDLQNYQCNIDSAYLGPYQCEFDYLNSSAFWYDNYRCFSDVKKCGYTMHEPYKATGNVILDLVTSNLSEGDKCYYSIYAPKQDSTSYIHFSQGIQIVTLRGGITLILGYQIKSTGENKEVKLYNGDIFDFDDKYNSNFRLTLYVNTSNTTNDTSGLRFLEKVRDKGDLIYLYAEIGTVRGGIQSLIIDQSIFGVTVTIGIIIAFIVVLGIIIAVIIIVVRRIRAKRLRGERLNENGDQANQDQNSTQGSIHNEELETMVGAGQDQNQRGQQRRRPNNRRNPNGRRNRRRNPNNHDAERIPINNDENNFVPINSEAQIMQSPSAIRIEERNNANISGATFEHSNKESVSEFNNIVKPKPEMIRPIIMDHDDFEMEVLEVSKRQSKMINSPDRDRPSKLSDKVMHTDDHLQHFELVEELKQSPGDDFTPSKSSSFEVRINSLQKPSKRIESERSINSAQKVKRPNDLDELKIVKISSSKLPHSKSSSPDLKKHLFKYNES